jgi:hypothetical protein
MKNSMKVKEERRRFPRIMVPVLYRVPRVLTAKRHISNLSLGGVRIFSDERLKPGERLELEFFLPSGLSVKAMARVVWIAELPEGSEAVYDVGMEFVEMSKEVLEQIKGVLEKN